MKIFHSIIQFWSNSYGIGSGGYTEVVKDQ